MSTDRFFVLGWDSVTRHRRSIVALIAGRSLPNSLVPEPRLDRYRGWVAYSSNLFWRKLRVAPLSKGKEALLATHTASTVPRQLRGLDDAD